MMRVQDLGRVDAPLVLFGGPYSNLQATQALLTKAAKRGAVAICTGDTVAYCARPAETVAALRQAGCAVVAGNCEIQLAAGADDCGCGFDDGSMCDRLSAGWYSFARNSLTEQDRHWMGTLPDLLTLTHVGVRYGVLHGGVQDVARFLWSTSPEADFEDEWDALEAVVGPVDCVIAGHSGIPFQRMLRRGAWVNAGVIGMPPHDGTPQTAYVSVDAGQAHFHRLDYDVRRAVADMEEASLIQGYDKSLTSGYWPSEDVLPPDLRLSLANG
ncbi:MAG: metallophosphoesterase [Tateyamaria sp.]